MKQCLRMNQRLIEGGIIPGRGNNMDKGPVLVLKEAHPVWSLESEVSRVDHVAEVEQEPDHTGLFGSWKYFGIYTGTRPNAEGLLFFLLLSPIYSLSLIPFCWPYPIVWAAGSSASLIATPRTPFPSLSINLWIQDFSIWKDFRSHWVQFTYLINKKKRAHRSWQTLVSWLPVSGSALVGKDGAILSDKVVPKPYVAIEI